MPSTAGSDDRAATVGRAMVQVADAVGGATPGSAGTERPGLRDRLRTLDVVLVLVIVLAAVLRFWNIGHQSLWYDEWVTADDLSKRLAQMVLVAVPQNEGSPPLYFLFGWAWVRILGDGDAVLRSLSAIFGVATVPVAYPLARDCGSAAPSPGSRRCSSRVNPLLIWYSQEARPYALFGFLGSLSLLLCVRAVNDDRTSNFVWWGLAAAATLGTHYYAVMVIVPELVWLVYAARPKLRNVALGCIPIVVVAIPLAKLAMDQQGRNQDWIADFHIGFRLAEAGRGLLLGPAQPYHQWWPLAAALLIVAAVVGVVLGDRHERSTVLVMLVFGFFGLAVSLVAMLLGSDYFLGRNLIVSVIPLMVVVAIGLGNRRVGAIGLAAVTLVSAGWLGVNVAVGRDADLQKADWQAVANLVGHGPRARAVVVDGYLGLPILRYVDDSRALRPSKLVKVRRARSRVPHPRPTPALRSMVRPGVRGVPLPDTVQVDGPQLQARRSGRVRGLRREPLPLCGHGAGVGAHAPPQPGRAAWFPAPPRRPSAQLPVATAPVAQRREGRLTRLRREPRAQCCLSRIQVGWSANASSSRSPALSP